MAKVPVAADAVNKSYYKYYEREIENLSPEQQAYVAQCKGTAEEALSIHDRNKLLEPGTPPNKTGHYPLNEGGLLVASDVPLPGVTADMLWWWWPWHSVDPLRYAIWDPEDHFDVKVDEEGMRRVMDPSVPIEEKTWNATHYVHESIGGPPDNIVIMFKNPAEMGYDWSKVGTPSCRFLISANAFLGPMKVPVVMTETASEDESGLLTFHARFWVGYHVIDGEGKYLLPPEVVLPDEVAMGLVGHNIKEFTHLAKILPAVYAEEKDNW